MNLYLISSVKSQKGYTLIQSCGTSGSKYIISIFVVNLMLSLKKSYT